MLASLAVLTLSVAATGVFGHGYVTDFSTPSKSVSAWHPYSDQYVTPLPQKPTRIYDTNGPITDVTSKGITCNTNAGAPAGSVPVATTVDGFKAGDAVTFKWDTWPESHKGPVMTYMANCNGDCSKFDATIGSVWFKIDESGYENGVWAADKLIADGLKWTSTIPADLAPGQYLLRHEILALHSAAQTNGAQFYPSCNQISITGSGSFKPAGVALPGAYSPTDPGIKFDLYSAFDSYPIPGPRPVS